MSEDKKFLYGPVPSRRLGLSLGIDIVPFKVCTLDCVYCQLGRTTEKTIERSDYVSAENILSELKNALSENLQADYITIGGSGEPTLNSQLGKIINGIKNITDIPVAVLTNGTLFYKDDVRDDCSNADIVMPSLDAGDERAFRRINRPHKDINIEKLVSGLCDFRSEFSGRIWLEVFFIRVWNTDDEQISRIKDLIARIRPDKIHLNTAVRPTAETGINRPSEEMLHDIAKKLGSSCEIIADFSSLLQSKQIVNNAEAVLSMLKRRPCSINDICSSLGLARNEAIKYITDFLNRGIITSEQQGEITFYKSPS